MRHLSRRSLLASSVFVIAGSATPAFGATASHRHHKHHHPKPSPPSPPTPPTPPTPTVKLTYGGLYDVAEVDGHTWLKTTWAQLEPSPGQYDFSAISQAAGDGTVRIHVDGGRSCPAWLSQMVGTVDVTNTKDQITAPCPRYWDARFIACYAALISALGREFDTNANVASINMFSCALIYTESLIMGGSTSSCAALYAAGLNQDVMRVSILAGLAVTMAAFPTTAVEFAAHSQWTWPTPIGQGSSWTDCRDLLNELHDAYGQHLVVTDYGLGPGEYADAQDRLTATALYPWMHQRAVDGYPIAFQATLGTPSTASAASACDAAISMKAVWFEHHGVVAELGSTSANSMNVALVSNVMNGA